MKFRVTISTEDGDQEEDFSSLPLAEEYAEEWIKGYERWSSLTFYPYDSSNHLRLYKTRKGQVVRIDKIG